MPQAEFIPRTLCPKLNLNPANTPSALYPSAITYFSSIPWTASILSHPLAIPFIPQCFNPEDTLRDQFLGATLSRPNALKHMLCVFTADDASHASDVSRPITRLHTLYAIGDGVSGPKGASHGGMIMTMMDEAMGSVFEINYTLGRKAEAYRTVSLTAGLDVKFLKPVMLGGPVCATAWVESQEGRKTKLGCVIRDGKGTELAKCTSVWVALRPQKI